MSAPELELAMKAAGIGAVAGLRSLTAPALVSADAVWRGAAAPSSFTWLTSTRVCAGLCLLALGEVIVDKLPMAPDRTIPPSVIFRAFTGGLVGAHQYASNRRPAAYGAVIGAVAAVAATYGALALRRRADSATGAPDPLVGLAEDVLAVGGGLGLLAM